MKTYFIKLVIVSGLILASCSRKPSACFVLNENKASAKVNEEVKYDASCTANGKSYTWDFGNGLSEIGVSVKTKYTSPGTYTVKLTVKNGPKSAVKEQAVTITN
jgi:PKD repeat protein